MGGSASRPNIGAYGSSNPSANHLAFLHVVAAPGRISTPILTANCVDQLERTQDAGCSAKVRNRSMAGYVTPVGVAIAIVSSTRRRRCAPVWSQRRGMVALAASESAFKDAGGPARLGESGVPLPPILDEEEEEGEGVPLPPILDEEDEGEFEFEGYAPDRADEVSARDKALGDKYSKYVVTEDDGVDDRVITMGGPAPKGKTADKDGEIENIEELDPVPDVDPEEVIFGKHEPFAELGMNNRQLLSVLPRLGFKGSTRVQAAAIPQILGKDRRAVIITAETGSGKTLAYLLPAFEMVLRRKPRPKDCPHPAVLIVAPGRELGYQIYSVARQLSRALAEQGKSVSVHSARTGWPTTAPDILITTPCAAAKGLRPCMSEDEVARREALLRIRDVELMVFDEADLLIGGGNLAPDVRTILTAFSTSLPDRGREVLPEAQKYYKGGVPVEMLDEDTLEWLPGKALSNADGTFDVIIGGGRQRFVSRTRLRGPGLALLIERGPRIVMAGATLESYHKSKYVGGKQDNELYNSGIGSPNWILKRWFPNAVRITSKWIHHRHPGIMQQDWVYIKGESRRDESQNMPLRMEKMVKLLSEQDPSIRTLVFASSADKCLAAQAALKAVEVECCGMHSGVPFSERLQSLKKFATGQVSVLICTDIAARGIDLPLCRHVVQLEFAKTVVDYLHRVGRAARAGRQSKATNFFSAIDQPIVNAILKAPSMGLDGDLLTRTQNRNRLRRTRKKQRRQEYYYTETRKTARISRIRTQKQKETRAAPMAPF